MRSGFKSQESHIAVRSLHPGSGIVIPPGTIIKPEDHPRTRRKRWFRKRFIERLDHPRVTALGEIADTKKINDATIALEPMPEKPSSPMKIENITPNIKHEGGPWYVVTLADGTTQKVKGKKKAEELIG